MTIPQAHGGVRSGGVGLDELMSAPAFAAAFGETDGTAGRARPRRSRRPPPVARFTVALPNAVRAARIDDRRLRLVHAVTGRDDARLAVAKNVATDGPDPVAFGPTNRARPTRFAPPE